MNLDHLVKVVSARFLHYKVTVFSFHILVIRSELVGPARTQREGIKIHLLEGGVPEFMNI